jgi:catechol 1,2-dioxygenase
VSGVSMRIDAINNRKQSGASESTVLGPFHLADSAEFCLESDIYLDQKGEPNFVKGRILGTDGAPVARAKIDVWQAKDEGFYDMQQKGIQPDFNLRGTFRTNDAVEYWFRGVKPTFYPIQKDGPVGALGRAGPPTVPHGAPALHRFGSGIRDAFDPDLRPRDPCINSGAGFGMKASLKAKFRPVPAGDRFDRAHFKVAHDFVLAPAQSPNPASFASLSQGRCPSKRLIPPS